MRSQFIVLSPKTFGTATLSHTTRMLYSLKLLRLIAVIAYIHMFFIILTVLLSYLAIPEISLKCFKLENLPAHSRAHKSDNISNLPNVINLQLRISRIFSRTQISRQFPARDRMLRTLFVTSHGLCTKLRALSSFV